MLSHQAKATHWLPSAANLHAPVQLINTPSQLAKVSASADLKNPIENLIKFSI